MTEPTSPPPPGRSLARGLPRAVKRGLLWGLLLTAIGIVVLATLDDLVRGGGRAELPVLGALPGFAFTDQHGDPVTPERLAGAPWVADLVFTRCTLVCPAMSTRMARLDRRLPPAVRLVSISVDPEHDTPEVLADWAGRLDASERWLSVTGDRAAIHRFAIEGLKLAVQDDPDAATPGEAIVHSDRFVVVDGEGMVRGYYDPFDKKALGRLERDAEALARAG
jgi:cytochrome oxidase Cu insertion factor (SCO1/SenC/PrrC family)